MTYIDDYGTWKLLGEINLSELSSYIAVPSNPEKTIRYSYLVDWGEWDKSIAIRSKCLVRWHYGLNRELPGFYSALYPKQESNIVSYKLIAPSTSLVPREFEAKLVPLNNKYYYQNVGMLPWTLKIEEYQNG